VAGPPCASKVATVPLVAGFPAEFPWPTGTVFLQTYDYPETNGFYALAVIPARMADVIKYYQDNLVTVGYATSPGDAEPGEVDVVLTGNGRVGNMRTGVPLGCEEVTITEVLLENPRYEKWPKSPRAQRGGISALIASPPVSTIILVMISLFGYRVLLPPTVQFLGGLPVPQLDPWFPNRIPS
jgi:hypothetical protein